VGKDSASSHIVGASKVGSVARAATTVAAAEALASQGAALSAEAPSSGATLTEYCASATMPRKEAEVTSGATTRVTLRGAEQAPKEGASGGAPTASTATL